MDKMRLLAANKELQRRDEFFANEVEELRAENAGLQDIIDGLIAAIDEHGGSQWRNPMVCCAHSWTPLRKAAEAAEAAWAKDNTKG